jgi:PAS domain-containing protein
MSSAKQTNLVGELDEVHLEKHSSPSAPTADRTTESALLVARAAILPDRADLHSELQRSHTLLAMAQSLTGTGYFGWNVASGEVYWSEQTFNIFEHDRAPNLTLEMVLRRIHPHDRCRVQQALTRASEARADFHLEYRWLVPDGPIKHLYVAARALTTSSGNLEFLGAAIAQGHF